ncbi:hypothetical protein EVA_11485 [gut metagenome]|uniref:Uncharacterized protein n=1 Tax=gut metagenome TaxID=749906 RepID=J9G0P8_9ZZZZ
MREINRLLAYFHLAIKPALFGQIANLHHVLWSKRMPVKGYFTAIGSCDAVDDTYQGGLAGSVRTKQTKYFAALHRDAYIVECRMLGIALHYVRSFEKVVIHKRRYELKKQIY